MSATLELTQALIAEPSITPYDAECQSIISKRLKACGFVIEPLPFGEVKNFWARHGAQQPLFVFAGHTDVVPTGPEQAWNSPPFKPAIRDGYLYGRGAADMKGSIAAMVVACEKFITQYPQHQGSIGFLITSDEEGPSINGTVKVIDHLETRKEKITWCIVGEPTSEKTLGDMIKNGRRGSLSGKLTIKGVQGHIAYPHLADNPIHKALPALHHLVQTKWDDGNEYFQPTSFQISNIHAGTGAGNVIPGALEILFNFRYAPASTAEQLKNSVTAILQQHDIQFDIEWYHSGKPFLTPAGDFLNACQTAIHKVTGQNAIISTSGGTSDGRFIAPTGAQVVELGPCNSTIHKIDECVKVSELDQLTQIYYELLVQLLT